jgi:hypothetical protein
LVALTEFVQKVQNILAMRKYGEIMLYRQYGSQAKTRVRQ